MRAESSIGPGQIIEVDGVTPGLGSALAAIRRAQALGGILDEKEPDPAAPTWWELKLDHEKKGPSLRSGRRGRWRRTQTSIRRLERELLDIDRGYSFRFP
jgi:hypothetical protein